MGKNFQNKIMNKIFLIIFLILHCLNAWGKSDQEAFLNANKLYKEGKFLESIKLYDSISHKDLNCWFNIGNCYYNLNNFALAIGYWKKALKDASYNDFLNIETNIEKAYKKLNSKHNLGLFDQLNNFTLRYLSLISVLSLQLLILLLLFLIILFWKKLIKVKFLLISLAFLNLFLLLLYGIKYFDQNKKSAIVLEPQAKIYAGPDKYYHILGSLDLGQEVKIIKDHNNWVKVNNKNLSGWINSETIFII